MGDIIRKKKGGKDLGWYIRWVDSDGKRKQRASHQPTYALAKRMLLEIEARVARGQAGMVERMAQSLGALGGILIIMLATGIQPEDATIAIMLGAGAMLGLGLVVLGMRMKRGSGRSYLD